MDRTKPSIIHPLFDLPPYRISLRWFSGSRDVKNLIRKEQYEVKIEEEEGDGGEKERVNVGKIEVVREEVMMSNR